MTKRKLLIGLVSAGAFTAGFGAAVFPATAQLRTITVTLVGGQTVTVQVDAPADTPLDQLSLPVEGEIQSATEVNTAAQTTTSEQPAETTTSTTETSTSTAEVPAPAGTETAPVTPTTPPGTTTSTTPAPQGPVAVKGGKTDQTTSGKTLRTDSRDSDPAGGGTEGERERDAADGAIRTDGGAPTLANPTYTEALPGAAPIGVPNFFIDSFKIPPFLLPIYQAAGIEYGIRWEILAAINEIETNYGRNLNVSSAGALGWMQFMPSTWDTYGTDANGDGKKDPYNPVDAIFSAARYLKAADADKDIRKAIWAYNHADWYVDSVLMRARLIGGLPSDLIGSLTGLTQGRFPVDAKAIYADDLSEAEYEKKVKQGDNAAVTVDPEKTRRGINIYAKAGSPVVATQDARVVNIGESERLGRFVQIRDVYGNTYTYGNLGSIAEGYGAAKESKVSEDEVRKELELPKDPTPEQAASSGTQSGNETESPEPVASSSDDVPVTKQRVFANPGRPAALEAGGDQQIAEDELRGTVPAGIHDVEAYAKVLDLKPEDIEVKRFREGAKIPAGTVIGQIGEPEDGKAPHLAFEIRPVGDDAPRIDPKPILDGWKLLEATAIYRASGKNPFFGPDAKNPTIGQILLMSKESLQRAVLSNPRIEIYKCGRQDIRGGAIDRRALATLEFLAASGLRPTVTSLQCGHGYYTASGNVSEHSTGSALDIAAINGVPILGHQGSGSITEMTIRRLLTLQGTMKPHQIISLMTFDGADNTISLPDHADHIHVGFRPEFDPNSKQGRKVARVLKPKQWIKLIDRLGKIDNPEVLKSPSKYATDVKSSTRKTD